MPIDTLAYRYGSRTSRIDPSERVAIGDRIPFPGTNADACIVLVESNVQECGMSFIVACSCDGERDA